mmetsp:Transcript_24125/g.77819  ORF Transcript_24125/g.77819 Transcript_24125/m.77819 type:complete len:310 (-) Transcript_24125:484-1413(-)|eukprot:CAMPEP_0118912308 /NCGR_PEP_ID=MMETSP1166-20130328/13618_1 /TAXON_ID=1104430 /ORGANISM="Chrysoreinhardia sp, Strain CCMP3193" /LENGTH=309 /DNA_ID=CAMNT_0006851825 /DNA_START=35 /DNA_END=964 /DNA_ORIENTATION=+
MSAQTETTTTGDFKGKQFAEAEVADKVLEQYSEEHARTFYRYVMGGGGYDIHYGIFKKASDGVFESSKATNAAVMETMDRTKALTPESKVLDLGSGHGGLSHELAKTYGCQVVSFNISPEQNRMNEEEAQKLGVGDLIRVVEGNFNVAFPPKEQLGVGEFTHVVSCEVFCHAASKPDLLQGISDLLAPGGALVFTDIMGADGADEKALKDFTDRNATTEMARPSGYTQQLKDANFVHVSFWDGSYNLEFYFKAMLDVCLTQGDAMIEDGVPKPYLQKWIDALTDRVKIESEKHVFAWGIFSARKPGPVF